MLRDFAEFWPEKFYNVTNGVTPRRFVALANSGLTELITRKIGESWLKDLNQLRDLELSQMMRNFKRNRKAPV